MGGTACHYSSSGGNGSGGCTSYGVNNATLSTGAIVGIVIGTIVAIVLVVIAIIVIARCLIRSLPSLPQLHPMQYKQPYPTNYQQSWPHNPPPYNEAVMNHK